MAGTKHPTDISGPSQPSFLLLRTQARTDPRAAEEREKGVLSEPQEMHSRLFTFSAALPCRLALCCGLNSRSRVGANTDPKSPHDPHHGKAVSTPHRLVVFWSWTAPLAIAEASHLLDGPGAQNTGGPPNRGPRTPPEPSSPLRTLSSQT